MGFVLTFFEIIVNRICDYMCSLCFLRRELNFRRLESHETEKSALWNEAVTLQSRRLRGVDGECCVGFNVCLLACLAH